MFVFICFYILEKTEWSNSSADEVIKISAFGVPSQLLQVKISSGAIKKCNLSCLGFCQGFYNTLYMFDPKIKLLSQW